MPSGVRLNLKEALWRSGRTQCQVAERTGIHPNRMSHIIRGAIDPTPPERRAIASALGTAWLFRKETTPDSERVTA
jgi:transcriptional regulator with XRE-family HTH domain